MKLGSQIDAKQPRSADLNNLDMSKEVMRSGSSANTVTCAMMQQWCDITNPREKICRGMAPTSPKKSKQPPTLWEGTLSGTVRMARRVDFQ